MQKIWETSCVTLKAATTDVIAEPARENVPWIFDACVGVKAAYYSFGDTHMWRHCLELAARGIDEDGVPHAVVPAGDSFMVLFDQVLFWVHSCREFYTLTGDKDFVKSVLPAIGRLLGLCKRHMTQDGLFIPSDYAWHWVDWAPLNKEPYSMPINGLLLLAAQAAMALEQALGAESTISLEIATLLQENLPRFYDEKEGAFRSRCPVAQPGHLCPINDTQPVAFDLHSNALAYMTGIGTREQRRSAVKKMVRMLPERIDGKPLFGIAWTQLILAPVVAEGYQREALQCLKSGYRPFLDVGAAVKAGEKTCKNRSGFS